MTENKSKLCGFLATKKNNYFQEKRFNAKINRGYVSLIRHFT